MDRLNAVWRLINHKTIAKQVMSRMICPGIHHESDLK